MFTGRKLPAGIQDFLQTGQTEMFMTRLKAFFADIPYKLNNKTEKHYQTVFYVLFKLMGQFVEAEPCTALGRADAVVVTADIIPFTAGNKKLVKIGAEFSTKTRGLSRWIVSE